jgi:hypothetical protein
MSGRVSGSQRKPSAHPVAEFVLIVTVCLLVPWALVGWWIS